MISIPGFDILERLGVGGMAEVWKARQVSLDRFVAIKILSARFSRATEDVTRFQQEAQAAARLKHPGIVQVYDANAIDGTYYFVMEYVAGYTVGDWLRRKGPLPEKDALVVAECVVDALSYGWDNARIIHCDIKPDNIMVDADGSVKVTDLGLARTISGMTTQQFTDEVLGTPAYMSPEQARGESDMDFRTDIYAMGATLYHALTGKLLFQGEKDEAVMELQVTGTVADPTDINPRLSKGVVWLLEKMLAKNSADRHESWQAVRADLARVRNGMLPLSRLPRKSASTVTRKSKRVVSPIPQSRRPAGEKANRAVPFWVFLLIVGLGALLAVFLYYPTESYHSTPRVAETPTAPLPAVEDPSAQFAGLYAGTRRWMVEHPESYDEGTARYRTVMKVAAGTQYEVLAAKGIWELQDKKRMEIDRVVNDLTQKAAGLVREGDYGKAIELLETYAGRFQEETRPGRINEAVRIRQVQGAIIAARSEKAKRSAEKFNLLLDRVAAALLEKGVEAARVLLLSGMADPDMVEQTAELTPLKRVLDAAVDMDSAILMSFLPSKGKPVTIMLANGESKAFVLDDVEKDCLVGSVRMSGDASITLRFPVAGLHSKERLKRMGSDEMPEVALVKGLMAFGAKAYPQAKTYFAGLPEPLAIRLMARGFKADAATLEPAASANGAPPPVATNGKDDVPAANPPVRPAAIVEKPLMLADADAETTKVVQSFLKRNRELVEEDILLFSDGNGAVCRMDVRSPLVRDLGPLSGLKALRALFCGVSDRASDVRDVYGLRGLPIERLHLPRAGIKDLGPLKGMPLRDLDIRGTPIVELDPLRGMPLERLVISDTGVRDIAPLRGMAIKDLEMAGLNIHDFGALASMPLQRLMLAKTQFRDLAPIRNALLKDLNLADTRVYQFQSLREMPLEVLDLSGSQIKDLSVLKGKALVSLNLSRTSVSDVGILSGMPLVNLWLDGTLVRNVAPLKGLPLKAFSASGTQIDDLSFLADSPVQWVNVSDTLVEDLSCLKNIPLESLEIQGTRVRDIKALKGLPIKRLNCQRTKVRDYSVLRGSGIEALWVDEVDEAVKRVLRGLPKLREVNGTAWERW